MSKSQQNKQRRVAEKRSRKASKRKKAQSQRTHHHADSETSYIASWPIHETLIADDLFEKGIGMAAFSRIQPDGDVAMGFFLLDVYCLGVKDAGGGALSLQEYDDFLTNVEQRMRWVEISPECLVKLIVGCVDYAMSLGFPPHKDYRQAKKVFGSVQPDLCEESFQFGQDGKPLYVAGPYDTPDRIERTLKQLERAVGPGGFEYICPVGESSMDEDGFVI